MKPAPTTPAPRGALAKSLVLHLIILVLLVLLPSLHLPDQHEPQYIQAVMISPHHNTPAPRPVVTPPPPQPVATPEPEPKPEPKPVPPTPPKPVAQPHETRLPVAENKKAIAKAPVKPVTPPKPEPKPAPAPKPAPTPPPVAKQPPKPEPKPAPKKPTIDQQDIDSEMADIDQQANQAKQLQRQQQLQQMQQEAAASTQALSNKANKQIVQEYVNKIKAQMRNNWIRPISAKNGMMSVLRISLQPGGDVSNVVTVQSSGDSAFDASAIAAVWKAAPLQVPDDADVFNNNFRSFLLRFKPDDL